ncbi:hypothetical protein [Janthinobacterium agaricidamnosum]|uniref:Putative membrane protein n=1 Tax=Janthinobacterium agaricidamnosum NBRC 102515 = DSM 9628 TaxID=1349767 RepID=W0V260_9BURK|nr:hypothetical protein [Janthinobacterium agaricidamnosum]CDG82919.1 putative membrane protein [Janthinobacterium agaricidamnosum NBRC 102515 = DSM 9628]
MVVTVIAAAWLAASCFYLASQHQSLWVRARQWPRLLRAGAGVFAVVSVWLAVLASGFFCGVFIALSAWMPALVALPYVDAWRRVTHVA